MSFRHNQARSTAAEEARMLSLFNRTNTKQYSRGASYIQSAKSNIHSEASWWERPLIGLAVEQAIKGMASRSHMSKLASLEKLEVSLGEENVVPPVHKGDQRLRPKIYQTFSPTS